MTLQTTRSTKIGATWAHWAQMMSRLHVPELSLPYAILMMRICFRSLFVFYFAGFWTAAAGACNTQREGQACQYFTHELTSRAVACRKCGEQVGLS